MLPLLKLQNRARLKLLSLLSILVTVSFLPFSCSKEEEVPDSYISFELDGVPIKQISKTDLTFAFEGSIQTGGKEKPSPRLRLQTPKLTIYVIDHGVVIQRGLYQGITEYPDGYTREVRMSYLADNGELYQTPVQYHDSYTGITTISRSGVSGNFGGVLISPSHDSLRIEKGEFSFHTYQQ